MPKTQLEEQQRLESAHGWEVNWQRWGPYLSERQWGTVREDYSANQDAWSYFPHDHARSRAYRWGEDGLLGICDRQCRLCFSFAFWNGKDPILKERFFGLTGPEGNHGEDVKECYYYLDSTPTHSYMKALYKYPQAEFPYLGLLEESRKRSRHDLEYELEDSGAFADERYFDCQIEYAKGSPNDILIRATITNRSPEVATLHVLPQWWFRNTWTWECTHEGCTPKPTMQLQDGVVRANHMTLGAWRMAADVSSDGGSPNYLFTDNETNPDLHPDVPTTSGFFKDAIHRHVVDGEPSVLNAKQRGTKVASHTIHELAPGESVVIRARMSSAEETPQEWFGAGFEQVFNARREEANAYYQSRISDQLNRAEQQVARQAYAGLLWTKQFYNYVIDAWLKGDDNYEVNTDSRRLGRNHDWPHLHNRDVISMPDKWEYPWYAAWDLAFHMLPMAEVDLEFAKSQLILFLREWYMHPNGALPAYEWALSDVNPPVHAWACWNVYQASCRAGKPDKAFLARVFQKLLLNFTWWVNRKDPDGHNIFSGGFLGLDNIGVFDRSKPLPTGGFLNQADATAWMAFFCGNMLQMAIELGEDSIAYADMASKFLEHYMEIADATNDLHGTGLWDEEDGFYYDHLQIDGQSIPLKVRSLVGLIPLCTPVILDQKKIDRLPGFKRRTEWFLKNRAELAQSINQLTVESPDGKEYVQGLRLLALPSTERLKRLLQTMLDESEFLSPYGIRSMSAKHEGEPYIFECHGAHEVVRYVPGESDSYMFGGNSNWRGPIWFPINYLLVESLRKYHQFYGDTFTLECPTGSGNVCNLAQVADAIQSRLIKIFLPEEGGRRPCHGEESRYAENSNWNELVLFYEYFHGDNGRGLGASHQTGWTALVASLLREQASDSVV
ncbi:MGH1-like glycoside hydrolase domain-containing protein [Aureliella helgolandensis]|uniref:Mannosyl oligosaccharide glucosidase n=1 Tax=Aureliella helgolandensis TaxID=2527968 RepID=A0A518G1G5_9BACT|nr:glucosidase [Aureliella helgolandensis]QDV22447.1 Mannosyl oligosaccharide glucosidase [Aureliella helgolandensis]